MSASAVAGTTERKVMRSTMAGYVIQSVRLLAGFLAKLALARLVLPEATAVYEEALRIVTVLSAVRDLGLPYHLVRDPTRPYGTVFWFVLSSGGVLVLLLVLGAPLGAALHPDLPAVLFWMAPWLLLDGLLAVPRAHLETELRIGRLVGPEAGRIVAFGVVSVALAAAGAGVWSFVVAELASTAIAAAWSWRSVRGEIDLRPRWSLLPGLLGRAHGLFLIWLLIQIVTYVDIFIIEGFQPTAVVGEYARAYWIAFLVATAAWPRPFLPALVAYRDQPRRLFEAFRLGAVLLLGLQVIGSYFVAWNAERVVGLLLGPHWAGAAPPLQVLAFIPFFDQFALLGGELLKSRHEDGKWLRAMALNLVSLVGFGWFLTREFGAPGMAAANYLLLGNLLMAVYLHRIFGRQIRQLWRDLAILYLVPLLPFALVLPLAPGGWPRFFASLAAAALSLALLAWRYGSGFRRFRAESSPEAVPASINSPAPTSP